MSSRWTGFFIWALVAASAAFWTIRIFAATQPVPAGAQAPQAIAASGPMDRLFGAVAQPAAAGPQAPAESTRFQLEGVIAPPDADKAGAHGGYALIAVDGQPARSWRVGAAVDGDTTLIAVGKRSADLGPQGGPAAFTLQLPDPSTAATGTLPAATAQAGVAPLPQRGAHPPSQPVEPMVKPAQRGGFAHSGGTSHAGFRAGFQSPANTGAAPAISPPAATLPDQLPQPPQPDNGESSQ